MNTRGLVDQCEEIPRVTTGLRLDRALTESLDPPLWPELIREPSESTAERPAVVRCSFLGRCHLGPDHADELACRRGRDDGLAVRVERREP